MPEKIKNKILNKESNFYINQIKIRIIKGSKLLSFIAFYSVLIWIMTRLTLQRTM